MRTTFVRWSDGGTQTHYIVAKATVTSFKVDYAVEYPVRVVASAPGTAAVSPVSADTFYAYGTSVALNASAPRRLLLHWMVRLGRGDSRIHIDRRQPRIQRPSCLCTGLDHVKRVNGVNHNGRRS